MGTGFPPPPSYLHCSSRRSGHAGLWRDLRSVSFAGYRTAGAIHLALRR
jgi:hypothetical protein